VSDDRFRSAELDDELLYPRFEIAFGQSLDRKTSPSLIRLLNRALRDVSRTTFEAKDHFHRPRPFQRFQLQHLCGGEQPPKPEPHPTSGSSYPSGHSAYGWAVAMILARIAPDRAEELLARAAEYAESRVVCGVHFPSDVAAGQVAAAAVVSRLDTSASFLADLARARAEVAAPSQK
jgi:acid phosphatase (class A)